MIIIIEKNIITILKKNIIKTIIYGYQYYHHHHQSVDVVVDAGAGQDEPGKKILFKLSFVVIYY